MNNVGAFWPLLKLELWRGRLPLLRSMIAPGLLLLLMNLRGTAQPATVLGLCGVALALSVVMVGLQVGRDRENGTLAYLAELPLSGELLTAVRFAAVSIFALGITVGLALCSLLWPAAGIPGMSVLITLALLSQVVGWIVVALLSRFSWTTVVTAPVLLLIALGFVADALQLSTRISSLFAPSSSAEAGAILSVVGAILWAGVGLVAVAAFLLGTRWFQPHGGTPTADAQELLRAYHADPSGR